jgi:hypothetical protein
MADEDYDGALSLHVSSNPSGVVFICGPAVPDLCGSLGRLDGRCGTLRGLGGVAIRGRRSALAASEVNQMAQVVS